MPSKRISEADLEEAFEDFIGEYTKQVNLEEYSKAVYFLEIETTDGIINKKLKSIIRNMAQR